MLIKDLIKAKRLEKNLTMQQLGDKLGIDKAQVSHWESGKRNPSLQMLHNLSTVLGYDFVVHHINVAVPATFGDTATPISPSTATTMDVPLVNQYAYAGYLDSYQNTTYMTELPKIPFFVDHFGKGNYMAFEVRGDSMDNGSSDSILNGDILLCRELGRQHWQSRLHITKYDFVIVHKTDGIIIKRITDHNVDTGDVTIHSLNSAYPDYQINLDDVNQLFNVLKIERKR